MSRVFIDIGGHFGESIFKALNPKFAFDRLYAFEPSNTAFARLCEIKDSRFKAFNFALSNKNYISQLYDSGLLGGSLFADKFINPKNGEEVQVRKMSEVLPSLIEPGDEIYLKINCEGCELAILDDLFDSDQIKIFESIYIDFDARKIPSLSGNVQKYKEVLNLARVKYYDPAVNEAEGWLGVEKWLEKHINKKITFLKWFNYKTFSFLKLERRCKFLIITYLNPYFRIYLYIRNNFKKLSRKNLQ